MGFTNKDTKPEAPEDVFRSMGINLRYRHYTYCVEQAQKHNVSISEYIRMLVEKDYEENKPKKVAV